jgi:phage FluMu gp28-like protein
MQENQIVKEYVDRFLNSLEDPVAFARDFLDFQPFSYQTEFLRDQSPLIAACCGRQVGKTTLAAIKALHYALSNRLVRVLIVSAGLRQSMILFDKIIGLIDACIPARVLRIASTRTSVRFANGSEIVALPCGREGSTLRGFTADLAILDEANFIPRIVIESVIRPTMITRPNARMIMISTPWMKDHPFHEAMNNPELGFKTYTWPTRMNPLVSRERLEREKRAIGEYDFNREYNSIFQDDEFTYFPSSLVLACTDDYELDNDETATSEPARNGEYHIGIDFGKHADHSAIAILQKIAEEQIRLVHLKEFELDTPYKDVIGWVRKLNDTYRLTGGCLDRTGVGEAPYEEIREFMPQIKGITLTVQAKEDLMGKLKLAMENHKITIPLDQRRLLSQITSQQCKPLPTGKLQFTHPSGTNDDLLWALALAAQSTLETRTGIFNIIGAKRNC